MPDRADYQDWVSEPRSSLPLDDDFPRRSDRRRAESGKSRRFGRGSRQDAAPHRRGRGGDDRRSPRGDERRRQGGQEGRGQRDDMRAVRRDDRRSPESYRSADAYSTESYRSTDSYPSELNRSADPYSTESYRSADSYPSESNRSADAYSTESYRSADSYRSSDPYRSDRPYPEDTTYRSSAPYPTSSEYPATSPYQADTSYAATSLYASESPYASDSPYPPRTSERDLPPVEMVPPTRRSDRSAESRKATKGSARRTTARPRRSRVTFMRRRVLAAGVLTSALAVGLWSSWPSGESSSPERSAADMAAAALRQKSDPAPAAEDSVASPTATPDVVEPAPQSGTGKLMSISLPTIAAPEVNPTRTVRIGLQIEKGAGVNVKEAAEIVSATLGDPRGWQTKDKVRFRAASAAATSDGDVDLTIVFASPDLTDELCAPLKTRGEVSCFNLRKVVLNVRRWTEGVAGYENNLAAYRQYMVNHETGHGIYHGHVECPGKGKPAPVMLQQTKGLDGCKPNPWPTVG